MSVVDIYKKSGYPIPEDKHDEKLKQFDYWDMIGFAEFCLDELEKEKKSEENQSLKLNKGKACKICDKKNKDEIKKNVQEAHKKEERENEIKNNNPGRYDTQ